MDYQKLSEDVDELKKQFKNKAFSMINQDFSEMSPDQEKQRIIQRSAVKKLPETIKIEIIDHNLPHE